MSQQQEDLEDLDTFLAEHFGRTPVNSQDPNEDHIENIEAVDLDTSSQDYEQVIGGRVRDFVGQNGERTLEEHSGDESDGCDNFPENVTVRNFLENGCECSQRCHLKFSKDELTNHILDTNELSRQEKELNIMTILQVPGARKTGEKRQRIRPIFRVNGKSVCRQTFLLCFDISKSVLKRLQKHVRENGVTPRVHGNTGRKPAKSIQYDDVLRVVRFIQNMSDERGIPQPAAPRGIDNIPVVFLPASTTKVLLHKEYTDTCETQQVRALRLTAFKDIWRTCLQHIRIATPRDDVCATCEKMRRHIMDAVSEEEKLAAVDRLKSHIIQAQTERDVYNECLRKSFDHASDRTFAHYTFDFSQSMSLPHFARQMGPLYFHTLRKIQLFGVRIDGQTKQLNFLIDENQTLGQDGSHTHGPDSVISMVDWVLQNHDNDVDTCSIHADNCPGQNKNRFVVGYFMWRVMTGQHRQIEYQMQVPGHARCLVDSGFANIKLKYRRHDSETLEQLATIVNESAAGNEAICYPEWTWRGWKEFLGRHFKPVVGISKFQYFRFTSEKPGIVTARRSRDDTETDIQILKNPEYRFTSTDRPPITPPAGLSQIRKQFFEKTLRTYVREANKAYY